MIPRQFRSVLSRTDSYTTAELRYRVTHLGHLGSKLVIESIAKVPHGVRHYCELFEAKPSEATILQSCLTRGDFSARPYVLGQAADDSTLDSVLALYRDCCHRRGVDPTALLVRTYPGWETPEKWNGGLWSSIQEGAAWNGTLYPTVWTTDSVLGLLMSLTGQHRSHLASALADALQAADPLRAPVGNTPPGSGERRYRTPE